MTFDGIVKTLGGAALAVVVMAGASANPAAAGVLANGEFAGGQTGIVTAVKTSGTFQIGTGTTTVTVPITHFFDALKAILGLGLEAAAPYVFHVGTLNSISAVSMTMKIDTYTFLFTQETVLTKANRNVQLLFDGNLISDTAHHILPTPAEFLVSFQQIVVGGSITTTYLLDVPPGGTVPEPVSIAILGAGLLGLGWVRRRA